MSIPPLVCSTPPPPEQCEDDKDHEDFDLTYNLSQEEDEDSTEYYGNYSSYNIYPTKSENSDEDQCSPNGNDVIENKEVHTESTEIINNVNLIANDNIFNENFPKCEENTLEDLNLKVDAVHIHSNDTCTEEHETEAQFYNTEDNSIKNTEIKDQGGTDVLVDENEVTIMRHEPVIQDTISENCNDDKDIEDSFNNLPESSSEDVLNSDSNDIENINSINSIVNENENIFSEKAKDIIDSMDDDFGDFEDFQFKNSGESQVLPENPDNPWDNGNNESPQFNAFADFESKSEIETASDYKMGSTVDACNDDEDFGDFDDFKSSTNTDIEQSEPTPTQDIKITSTTNVPVLNLHSPENELQIADSLNNVLSSIFTKEVTEPDTDLDVKLEMYLSETWGHLVDIDVRQPYIVNWNNSMGQKTLLKALCIDSRNILFGPKWSFNMPKYATNLTAAPLQPQKPIPQTNIPAVENIEKVPSKEASSWVDPFTPDGREYTYAEALLLDLEHLMATLDQMAHKHSTLKISELLSHACSSENENPKNDTVKRPTDLDVLGSEKSSKLNNIYSSTINVQPLRQISLPDTHIFTPTDSETPRSKTIHYDSGPGSAPPVTEIVKNPSDPQVFQSGSSESNEYWEFQDFKGTTSDISTTQTHSIDEATDVHETKNNTAIPLPKTGITYHTQILQPIKIEPIIPTLNWPAPGEVKETFDDFSDFISSTSWNNEKDTNVIDNKKEILEVPESKEAIATKTENDDEFETFQSAPALPSSLDFSMASVSPAQNKISDKLPDGKRKVENLDDLTVKVETTNNANSKGNKLLETSSKVLPNNVLGMQNFAFPEQPNINSINHHFNSSVNTILQPTNSTASIPRTQKQNTGQILQPLSLESYSQINWPNPGIDLQDLSRFNPVNSVHSLKTDMSSNNNSKGASPAHSGNAHHASDDDIWGDFVSSAPKPQSSPKKPLTFAEDDEWTDFVSSPSIKPINGLNTISLNVHTNLNMQKSNTQGKLASRNNQISLDIPTLNYITPKSNRGMYTEQHFQNL